MQVSEITPHQGQAIGLLEENTTVSIGKRMFNDCELLQLAQMTAGTVITDVGADTALRGTNVYMVCICHMSKPCSTPCMTTADLYHLSLISETVGFS